MCLKPHFLKNGILHKPHKPQQNGRVEDKHRYILNMARTLLFQANLPIQFWGKSVLTVSYLINYTPSVLKGKTPSESILIKLHLTLILRFLVIWHMFMIMDYLKINFGPDAESVSFKTFV